MVKKARHSEDDDEEYVEEEHIQEQQTSSSESTTLILPLKRNRSKSEGDIYCYKINQRSKNDDYFRKQSREKQIEILKKEDEIYKYNNTDIPLRYKIIDSGLNISTKLLLIQKIDLFEKMTNNDSEYMKLSKWMYGLSLMPFDKYVHMPINISNTKDEIQKFLLNAFHILEKTIYGQQEAKSKILEILGQWITNPSSTSQIIALEGPPGVGKTSLIKNGVSKALIRPFCFYALGGANDISTLEGHSYTYEGAHWGKLIEMLMESKVMNPIIFFDELDKISNTVKGHEIIGLLTHLTDSTQNSSINDKYFSEINMDFSKTLFFFSYNNIEFINPILKDRLTIVKFKGYSVEDKIKIVKDFILPETLLNIGIDKNDVVINNNIIEYLILKYTNNEDGVRNIKKIIETILLKINLLKLMNNNDSLKLLNYKIQNVKFPLLFTKELCDMLL